MDWGKPEPLRETPCCQCGECCLAATCVLGQAIFLIREDDVCPAIEIGDDKLYYCGLISNTAHYISGLVGEAQWKIDLMHDVFVKLVGIGIGCTNGEQTGKEHTIDKPFNELLCEAIKERGQSE